jgi:hypothetical protein
MCRSAPQRREIRAHNRKLQMKSTKRALLWSGSHSSNWSLDSRKPSVFRIIRPTTIAPTLPEMCSAAWPTTIRGRKCDTILKGGIDFDAQNALGPTQNTNTALAIYLRDENKLPRRACCSTTETLCMCAYSLVFEAREHKACWFSRAQVPKENIREAVSELCQCVG